LRFLLELCALAALVYWGLEVGSTVAAKVLLFAAAAASLAVAGEALLAAILAAVLVVNEILGYAWGQREIA
jgi:hypothetical protein